MPPHEAAAASRATACSECGPEPQLHHSRLIDEALDRNRLPVIRVALSRFVISLVFVVEQVVSLQDALERDAPSKLKPLLQSKIHAVDGEADKAGARHDGSIRTQAVAALPTLPQVTAVARGKALTGAVEIEAAQLETAAHQPDTVECRPVALVGGRERVFATQIRRDGEGDRLGSTEGWGRHVIEPR